MPANSPTDSKGQVISRRALLALTAAMSALLVSRTSAARPDNLLNTSTPAIDELRLLAGMIQEQLGRDTTATLVQEFHAKFGPLEGDAHRLQALRPTIDADFDSNTTLLLSGHLFARTEVMAILAVGADIETGN